MWKRSNDHEPLRPAPRVRRRPSAATPGMRVASSSLSAWLLILICASCTGTGADSDKVIQDSEAPDSDTPSVDNTPPTAPTIAITPQEPTTLEDLVVTVTQEPTDPDGDELVVEFRWFEDGTDAGYTGSTLPASATARGETWTAEAQAHDGEAPGPAAEASVVVLNSDPEPPGLVVLPEAPTTDDDLICVVTEPAFDPDGDELSTTFAWTVDDVAFEASASTVYEGDTVPAAATGGTERWRCVVTVSDGEGEVAQAEAFNSIERELTRGYRVLSEWGLSLQTWDNYGGEYTDPAVWEASNLTTNWGTELVDDFPDQPFGLFSGNFGDARPLELAEIYAPYIDRLTTIQLGDEEDFSEPWLEENGAFIRETWAHLPDVVVHTNHYIGQIWGDQMERWIQEGRPDLLTWDTYHFNGSSEPGMGHPFMLSNLMLYRNWGLSGHDGAGEQPIPFGQWAQAFEATYGYTLSESELRLSTFATWTFGGRWLSLFAWNAWNELGHDVMVLFDTFPNSDPTPTFYEYAQALAESRNLSPALSALFNVDVVIQSGQHLCGAGTCTNPLPEQADYWLTASVEPWRAGRDPWIVGLEVENPGVHNDGLPGDVVISRFEPLLESCDGPDVHGEPYWMVLNSFIATNLGDSHFKTGGAEETAQLITLTFALPTPAEGEEEVTGVLRLGREDGEIELLPLVSTGDGQGTVELEVPGGTADLIKLDTGAAFCGIELPG
jgi:hypothetical protein